jgi:alpha-beta hydrolase superfamily lysophospholipase
MKHFEFEWQTADGLQLFAQGWQPKAEIQAVVCLVHGLGEHSGCYAHVAAALTQASYALLAFDLRGHGKSRGQARPCAFLGGKYYGLVENMGILNIMG